MIVFLCLKILYYIKIKTTTVALIKFGGVYIMKKSSFVAMILGTVSCFLFAIGMCMTLIPEWNAFKPGIVFGGVGVLLALITLIIWRKMEHKAPIHISGKLMLSTAIGVIGALALGIGMCFTMVWGKMALGIIIGLIGVIVLLCLIPLTKGIKE